LRLQVLRAAPLPDDPDPPPLRDEGVVGDEDHGPLLDPDLDPVRLRLRALLPLLLPLFPRMTLLVLDGTLLGDALAQAGDEGVVAAGPPADGLEELEHEARDPRVAYLIGDPVILPLPNASVDRALGEGDRAELGRVLRP